MPKDPKDWLDTASQKPKGIFKLFLGYAPGVGKTYSMLSEGIRRRRRGEDVVIGLVEAHGRRAIEQLAAELEAVPRRQIDYKGAQFEEMDVEAIIARRPEVVLVDELAHTNIPGSKNRKRYEDIQEILAAKIDVLSTLNIQHIESLTPVVRNITGITVRETVPDWIPLTANESVMVDLTPEALSTRIRRGDVYAPHKIDQALSNFFRRGNLIALRELALRQVAEQVDRSLETYMSAKDIQKNWAVRERLAVCVRPSSDDRYLIARAARIARRLDAELYAIHVDTGRDREDAKQKSLAANLQFAESLGAKVERLKGSSVADTVAEFVRERHVTQVIFGRSAVKGWKKYLYLSPAHRFLRESPEVDVHIITQEKD